MPDPNHVLPWLIIGDKKLAKDRAFLSKERVKYILNATPPLTEGGVAAYFQSDLALEYLRLPLRDVAAENMLPLLPSAVEFLQRARVRADGRVLVHCQAGRSRSAAVVSGFLVLALGKTLDEALAMARAARAVAEPNQTFLKQLGTLTPAVIATDVDGFGAAEAVRPRAGGSKRGASTDAPAEPAKRAMAGPSGLGTRPSVGPSIGPPRAARERA